MKNDKNLFRAKLISFLFVLPNALVALYCFNLIIHEKTSLLLENLKKCFNNFYFQITIILIYIFSSYYFLNIEKKKRKKNQITSNKVEGYYREVPCNSNLERAYWVLYHYTDMDEKILKSGIIGAFILKWVKEKNVFILDNNNYVNTFRDDNYRIDLGNGDFEKTKAEETLYDIFKAVAGDNNILEKREFLQWQKNNVEKLNDWYKKLIKIENLNLEKEGFIQHEEKLSTPIEKGLDSKFLEDAKQLLMLKNYLLDYSLIKEREHIEVALWEEYLIFAELFGIADKVNEQFSKLIPNYSVMSKIIISISYNNLVNTVIDASINKIFITAFSGGIVIFVLFIIVDIIVIRTIFQSIAI